MLKSVLGVLFALCVVPNLAFAEDAEDFNWQHSSNHPENFALKDIGPLQVLSVMYGPPPNNGGWIEAPCWANYIRLELGKTFLDSLGRQAEDISQTFFVCDAFFPWSEEIDSSIPFILRDPKLKFELDTSKINTKRKIKTSEIFVDLKDAPPLALDKFAALTHDFYDVVRQIYIISFDAPHEGRNEIKEGELEIGRLTKTARTLEDNNSTLKEARSQADTKKD